MKLNKIYNVLALTGLVFTTALSTNALAINTPYTFGFTTVADVTLEEVTELNFGGQLDLQVASTCEMQVSNIAAEQPGNVKAKMADGTVRSDGADFGKLNGVGCGAGASGAGSIGTVGVYKVTGAGGVNVLITLASQGAGTSFNFVPDGIAVNYSGDSDNDTFTAVDGATTGVVQLANTADLTGNSAGSGTPIVGETLIYIGGAVTVNQTLLAGQEYTETFGIDVIYN